MDSFQSRYKRALHYAALKHQGQQVPGTKLPYLVHVMEVAMEVTVASLHTSDFDKESAVLMAILHDTIEDSEASYQEVVNIVGEQVADGVLALTKFSNLKKEEQMKNSIERIKLLEKEVWAVKLADRITNLDAPPLDWDRAKRIRYRDGSINILNELGPANEYLADRLREQIQAYESYVNEVS